MAVTDTKIVISALDLTKAAFESAKNNLEKLQASSSAVGGAIGALTGGLAALGATVSVGAFAQMTKNVLDLQDNLYKMSQRTGVAVEELSTLRYAADLSGVGVEDLDSLLVKLNKTLAAAGTGDKTAIEFLQQFGIAADDVKSGVLTTDEALKRIADRFASSPDGINKSTAALELFGKSGAKLISFLNTGRDGIESLQTEAAKLGLKLSTESARGAEELNDQLRTLEFYSEGLRTSFVNSLVPAISAIVKEMKDATIEGGKFAGIMKGLQTFLTGNDQYKNDKALVDLTEKKLVLENEIANARARNNGVRVLTFSAELVKVEAELKTTMAYRAQLELVKNAEEQAAKARENAKKTGGQLAPRAGAPSEKAAAIVDALKSVDSFVEQLSGRLVTQTDGEFEQLRQKAIEVFGKIDFGKLSSDDQDRFLQKLGSVDDAIEKLEDRAVNAAWAKALADGFKEAGDAAEKANDALRSFNETQSRQMQDLEFELAMVGKLASERQRLAAIRRIDLDAQRQIAAIPENAENRGETIASITSLAETAKERTGQLLDATRAKGRDTYAGLSSAALDYFDRVSNGAENIKMVFNNSMQSMEDAFVKFATTGKMDFKSLANSIISDIARIQIRQSVTGPLSKALGGFDLGALAGKLFSGNSNPGYNFTNPAGFADVGLGFANGGSFMVGGSGGTDSQMVAFRASPDERVTIETPGQRSGSDAGGSSVTIVQNISVDARSDMASLMAAMNQAKESAKSEIASMLMRNGQGGIARAMA